MISARDECQLLIVLAHTRGRMLTDLLRSVGVFELLDGLQALERVE